MKDKLLHLPLLQRLDLALELSKELQDDDDVLSLEERSLLKLLISDLTSPQEVQHSEEHEYPVIEDRSILITGASLGSIAHFCAEYLLGKGWKVYTTVRNQEQYNINKEKGFIPFIMDYRDSNSIDQLVQFVLTDNNGKLGALFNNGGNGQYGCVEDLLIEGLIDQFEVYALGWIELTEKLLPTMINQKYGRVIMHGSILGIIPLNYRGAYNSAKAFVKSLSDGYRVKYREHGIGFSLIETGPVRSNIRANSMFYFKKYVDSTNSRHKDTYTTQIEDFLNNPEQVNPFTEQPISVAVRLLDILESSNPRARYMVTAPTYSFNSYKKTLSIDTCLSMSWLDSAD